jgi:hypothetical protein
MICCSPKQDYSDHYAPIVFANVQKITIEIQGDQIRNYSITERQEIIDFINDLETSKVNGLWKGAKWDRIVLHYVNGDEKVFSTNGEVFGQGSNGTFYDLNSKYKKYWEQ